MTALNYQIMASCIEQKSTAKENHDRLMVLYRTGTNVKRSLLQHYLTQNNINLADYLTERYHFLPPDDVKRAIRKNSKLEDLGIFAIDVLLTDHCYDLFWNSCLDTNDKNGLDSILNRYKNDLFVLYKKSDRTDNELQRNVGKREYLSKTEWEMLFKGPENKDISEIHLPLYLYFPNKGLTIKSFDNDMNFILLSTVCPLYKSLRALTANQMKVSRIAIEHEIKNEAFDEIWDQIEQNLKQISSHCISVCCFEEKINSIKKSTSLNSVKIQRNRKHILESTLYNPIFLKDTEFFRRVQEELNLIDLEETKYRVTIHCDKDMDVSLDHGQYKKGSYPSAIAASIRKDIECCRSVCSRQSAYLNPNTENIDVVEEQKRIKRHNYLKIVMLILDVAKEVLVEVLKVRFHRTNFGDALLGMKKTLLPRLNDKNIELIYPDKSKYAGDLSDMDISLLYIILRNIPTICPHQKGWGNAPEENDRCLSANIERIRIEKNIVVSHFPKFSLEYEEFKNKWETMRQCCVELGGKKYEHIIDTLSTYNFESEQRISELLEIVKNYDERNERTYRKLLELEEGLLDFIQKEEAFRESHTHAICEDGCTLLILRIKGNYLPYEQEIIERSGNFNNQDMRFISADRGSIIMRLEMFSSAFQSFEYFLAVIDILLQNIFPTRPFPEDNLDVMISISVELVQQFKVEQRHSHDLPNMETIGRNTTVEKITMGMYKSKTLKNRSTLLDRNMGKEPVNENRNTRREEDYIRRAFSKEENDSIWLFDVLDIIGANDEFRKICQRAEIMQEILVNFQNPTSLYCFGSVCEGSITPGQDQDTDYIECDEKFSVIEDIAKASSQYKAYLLVITEEDTPAGYVKLQRVIDGTRQTVKHWPLLHLKVTKDIYKLDKYGRVLLFDLPTKHRVCIFLRRENKPALTIETGDVDRVESYRCTTWPTIATEWLNRRRMYGWPAEDTIKEMESFGFFVIKKGHPCSPEKDFDWRISFSLQERKLMFSLTDVQHKCYIVLKMLNRDIIKLNEFTSYHWKTCLFYTLERNDRNVWDKKHLFYCVKLCLTQMLKWVKCGFCPNYFIPGDNLFDGKLNKIMRSKAANELENILKMGFNCFRHVKSNDICNYMESRESPQLSQRLQSHSKDKYKHSFKLKSLSFFTCLFQTFNHKILDQYYLQPNRDNGSFIKFLWDTIDHIKQVTVTEHTKEETRSVLSELLPHIFTCLASNISAIAIQHSNPQVRDFLLLGSFTFLKEAGLIGCLKFISVLYAVQLHEDCEWFLDQIDEKYIKDIPSVCTCNYMTNVPKYFLNTSSLDVITCICFLPSELEIIPHAMKYEMFRYFGIKLNENEKANMFNLWHYRTVCDCNTYFYFLKYLIKMRLGKVIEACDALNNLVTLVTNKTNVQHIDIGFNLIALIYYSVAPLMLHYLAYSWIFMNQPWEQMISKLTSRLCLGELKRTQYQFNAAKLHALVLLYNTWFARKPLKNNFCFNCFSFIGVKLQTCSMCQVSTYCSAQCQSDNLKIHKNVCKIVSRYH